MSARPPTDLPPLDADAEAHGVRVAQHLRSVIAEAGGVIPFSRFMEQVLYAPGLGYYSAGSRKFGEAGDFVTAPEISPLFARCLANQFSTVLAALGGGDVLEIGAGTGRMAADTLKELERLGWLPDRYRILELSGELRQRQHETIAASVPHLLARVEWLDVLPSEGIRGVVVGNEVLDAMPVTKFRATAAGLFELGVGVAGEDFVWREFPASDHLSARITELRCEVDGDWSRGYESEINEALPSWINGLAAALDAGLILFFDYGFPRREYYHADRVAGTLMCHYRHRAHTDPLVLAGLQDITAHVDFTAVAEAAHAAGLDIEGYTTQANFLLGADINRYLEDESLSAQERLQLAQGTKKLVLPSEMGELFKVIGLSRDLDAPPLTGFALRDLRFML